jgi:hypothetical protein
VGLCHTARQLDHVVYGLAEWSGFAVHIMLYILSYCA